MNKIPLWMRIKAGLLLLGVINGIYQIYCFYQYPHQTEFEEFYTIFAVIPALAILAVVSFRHPPLRYLEEESK
jgi:hypothetical protein